MHLAAQQPERVDSLIVIDIAPQAYTFSEQSTQGSTHTRILDAMLAVDFAIPSINPTITTGAPRTVVKKIGKIGAVISEAISLKKLTNPRVKTFFGIPNLNFSLRFLNKDIFLPNF